VHNYCPELPTQANGYWGRRQQYKSYSTKSTNVNKSLSVKSILRTPTRSQSVRKISCQAGLAVAARKFSRIELSAKRSC
jgi:hypothetical protein